MYDAETEGIPDPFDGRKICRGFPASPRHGQTHRCPLCEQVWTYDAGQDKWLIR